MSRLVLVGAGHAHMPLICGADRLVAAGHEVVVVSPRPHHYYSGMGPGMFAGRYSPGQDRFPAADVARARGVSFVEGMVGHIDHGRNRIVLGDGRSLDYDVLSCNIGSSVLPAFPVAARRVYAVKPIENLLEARAAVREYGNRWGEMPHVLVVGGGVGGCELVANLVELSGRLGLPFRRPPVLLSSGILREQPPRMRLRVTGFLRRRGVAIRHGRVDAVEQGAGETCRVHTDDGRVRTADMVLLATGIRVPDLFLRSGLTVGGDPGLAVGPGLNSPLAPNILGGGDCINFLPRRLDKVGVFAVREQPILQTNVGRLLEGNRDLVSFVPQRNYLVGLNLGDGIGIITKWGVTARGRLAFLLKDYLDRAFIRAMRTC